MRSLLAKSWYEIRKGSKAVGLCENYNLDIYTVGKSSTEREPPLVTCHKDDGTETLLYEHEYLDKLKYMDVHDLVGNIRNRGVYAPIVLCNNLGYKIVIVYKSYFLTEGGRVNDIGDGMAALIPRPCFERCDILKKPISVSGFAWE